MSGVCLGNITINITVMADPLIQQDYRTPPYYQKILLELYNSVLDFQSEKIYLMYTMHNRKYSKIPQCDVDTSIPIINVTNTIGKVPLIIETVGELMATNHYTEKISNK